VAFTCLALRDILSFTALAMLVNRFVACSLWSRLLVALLFIPAACFGFYFIPIPIWLTIAYNVQYRLGANSEVFDKVTIPQLLFLQWVIHIGIALLILILGYKWRDKHLRD
jgi:hypothetical protein